MPAMFPARSPRPELVTGSAGAVSPPRKRPRLDTEPTMTEYSPTLSSNEEFEELESHMECERHGTFYKPDGDIVIRVQATLFRVHRFLLSRDSSAFEDMFSMPRGEGSSLEGYSDDQPIVLEGENVNDFAELLFILYALPAELHSIRSDSTNVCRLLTIAQITNKYHFVTTSSWAVSALCQVTQCPTEPWRAPRTMYLPPRPRPSWCTAPILRRIIEVAVLCGHQLLCDHAVEKWVQLIVAGESNPVRAIDIADDYGLARLKGVSYYEILMSCDENMDYLPIIEDDWSENHPMSPAQKAGLLSGYFSLVRRWERLRESAPVFTKPDGCTYHAHGCLSTWQSVWKSTTKSDAMVHRRTVDVLGRLRGMAELLEADRDLRCALTPACRRAAMDSVKELYEKEEEELANHFVDLTRPVSR